MNRRQFLHRAGAASAGLVLTAPSRGLARAAQLPPPTAPLWRTFEITTRVEILQPSGVTRVWAPTPLPMAPFQRTMGDTFYAAGGDAYMVESEDVDMVSASWSDELAPLLTLVSTVQTLDYSADLTTPSVPPPLDNGALARFLRPTKFIPTDGLVREKSNAITKGAGTDVERARAIYDWIVDNTFRDPATRGCGLGDIRFMLESGHLSGKCADLNALFVGLARAAGIPARETFGLRVAASRRGFHSLGLSSADATRAQHCRAEVYLTGFGWVPVDPADVRKVALEEPPGHLAIDSRAVREARARLFGSWEMNWIGYNTAHDLILPGGRRDPLPFLMYPQCETANGRLDSLDPENFRYTIAVREIR